MFEHVNPLSLNLIWTKHENNKLKNELVAVKERVIKALEYGKPYRDNRGPEYMNEKTASKTCYACSRKGKIYTLSI